MTMTDDTAIATTSSSGAARAALERATYQRITQQLSHLAAQLGALAEQISGGAAFVAGCAEATRHRAEQMTALGVDAGTVSLHQEAATAMDHAKNLADRLAAAISEMSTAAGAAAADHRGQYGGVAETAQTMQVQQARPAFYANR